MFVKKLSNFFARVSIAMRCDCRVVMYMYVCMRVCACMDGQGQGTKKPPWWGGDVCVPLGAGESGSPGNGTGQPVKLADAFLVSTATHGSHPVGAGIGMGHGSTQGGEGSEGGEGSGLGHEVVSFGVPLSYSPQTPGAGSLRVLSQFVT